jgi:hypothetical protein
MIFDWNALSNPHYAMVIGMALIDHGLDCQIFNLTIDQNEYSEMQPEETYTSSPAGTCKILLSEEMKGLQMSDFISLSDKVVTTWHVTTTTVLTIDQLLLVTYPDGKTLNLRITENLTTHVGSTSLVSYLAVVQ